MYHFILRLLVVTIICQGIGWASDFHNEALFGHETPSSYLAHDLWPSSAHPLSDYNENQGTNNPSCDHCCHGASHLTGITASPLVVAYNIGKPHIRKLDTIYYSFTHSPPTPPPNTYVL